MRKTGKKRDEERNRARIGFAVFPPTDAAGAVLWVHLQSQIARKRGDLAGDHGNRRRITLWNFGREPKIRTVLWSHTDRYLIELGSPRPSSADFAGAPWTPRQPHLVKT